MTVCNACGPPVEEPMTTSRVRMRGDALSPNINAFLTESVIFYALHLTALYLEEVADDLIPQAA